MSAERPSVLILWNHVGEDVYERWKEQGPARLDWDPEETAAEVGTLEEEMDALVAGLASTGCDVVCVNVEDDLDRLMWAINEHDPDVVFNLVEHFHDDEGQEANVVGLYELLGVEYTGNRAPTLLTCQDKIRTKMLLSGAGLPTPRGELVSALPLPNFHHLRFPLIVKPAYEDASGGIDDESVVHDQAQLLARVTYILEWFEQPAIVEEFIDGREIHVALLGNPAQGGEPEVLPLFEMEFDDSYFQEEGDAPRPNIISYSAKWDPTTKAFYCMEAVCPAVVEPALAERIRAVARQAFAVMACRDYARVDMRIDRDGNPYILEVNPNPDLAQDGAFEMCSAASGRAYGQTLRAIVDSAMSRLVEHEEEPAAEVEATDAMLRRHGRSAA